MHVVEFSPLSTGGCSKTKWLLIIAKCCIDVCNWGTKVAIEVFRVYKVQTIDCHFILVGTHLCMSNMTLSC